MNSPDTNQTQEEITSWLTWNRRTIHFSRGRWLGPGQKFYDLVRDMAAAEKAKAFDIMIGQRPT